MKTSPSITKISAALLVAQKAIGSAKKDSVNPFFKSSYADLGAVMEACKSQLNEAGITVLQPVFSDAVETILLHESGEWVSDYGTPIVSSRPNDPQAQGSAITYAKRYGLQALLFIPSEDDDGEKAMDRKTSVPSRKTPEPRGTQAVISLLPDEKATAAQISFIQRLYKEGKVTREVAAASLTYTKKEASNIINGAN